MAEPEYAEKNALDELAKEIQSIINTLEIDNFSTVGIDNLRKAQRIIAELAKVGKRRDAEFCLDYITECVSVYELGRAVAEEGMME